MTEKKPEGQVSGTQYKTENTTAKGKVGENTSYLCQLGEKQNI